MNLCWFRFTDQARSPVLTVGDCVGHAMRRTIVWDQIWGRKFLPGATVRCAKVALRCFVFPQGGPDPEAESLRCSCISIKSVAKDGTAHPQEIWQLSTLDTGYGSCELYFHRLVCACWLTCRGSQKHEQTIFLVILMVSDVHFTIGPGPLWTHDPWVAHYSDHGPTTRPSPYTSVVTATPHSKVGLGGGAWQTIFLLQIFQ